MPSDKQIQASRSNGARSKGPVTPQGKANSSRNSYRHGLLSSTVVLEEESTERFLEILTDFMDEFQPATVTQISLVETMAVARWRLLRIWGAQKTAMDRDMAMQDPADGPAAVRLLVALSSLSDNSCPPELLLRYEIAFDRQFSRALVRLLDLQSRPGHTRKEAEIQEIPTPNEPSKLLIPNQSDPQTPPPEPKTPDYPARASSRPPDVHASRDRHTNPDDRISSPRREPAGRPGHLPARKETDADPYP